MIFPFNINNEFIPSSITIFRLDFSSLFIRFGFSVKWRALLGRDLQIEKLPTQTHFDSFFFFSCKASLISDERKTADLIYRELVFFGNKIKMRAFSPQYTINTQTDRYGLYEEKSVVHVPMGLCRILRQSIFDILCSLALWHRVWCMHPARAHTHTDNRQTHAHNQNRDISYIKNLALWFWISFICVLGAASPLVLYLFVTIRLFTVWFNFFFISCCVFHYLLLSCC